MGYVVVIKYNLYCKIRMIILYIICVDMFFGVYDWLIKFFVFFIFILRISVIYILI